MPIVNHIPPAPTSASTRSHRFHVIAEVTGSYGEKATRKVYGSNDVNKALAYAHGLAVKGCKFVEVRNPSNGWQKQLTA
jgi:hypothetical protein